MNYNLEQLWNETVYSRNKELEPRDYCYASEIGGALVDRWLKMKAVTPTNPPNMRSLRKFEAGNLTEWVVRMVLQRLGIIENTQERVYIEYPDQLKVSGKLDFLLGGRIDLEKAKSDISNSYLPESIQAASLYIAEKLFEKYGDVELQRKVIEIKSCSTFVMDRMEKDEKPIGRHKFQLFHYMKGLGLDGELVYICRDDLRMKCFQMTTSADLEKEYLADVMAITKFFNSNTRPDIEPLITLEGGRFGKNLDVEYSPYLTMLYGYETPRDYSDSVKSKVARWSRVVARYAKGDKITKKNEEVRAEIIAEGYDFEQVVRDAQRFGVEVEETEE